ncbi:hypothetical protein CCR75_005956 [Bremia lactucae]|uniref:DNA/RNA-binding protein Alba-like domain-containing protein n=1 Tax=Bremia lactucae TaxID=4779 RepID=A0A976FHC3_BRELC|nr:hypothetical protein CCR75_005956 [Bremia lactucae]
MAHYGRAGGDRMQIAVDVDHTLAKMMECAAEWHEEEHGAKIDVETVESSSWSSIWGENDAMAKTHQFYESRHFETGLAVVAGANEVLKPLRKYFALVAITDRPRVVEKQTREWLDHHFSGVFDKLAFVNEESSDRLISRKKLYDDFKVKIAVSSDAAIVEAAANVEYKVFIGSVPWSKKAVQVSSNVFQVTDWSAAKEVFAQLIEKLELEPIDKIFPGPRLSRYNEDLVTVSTRKPAVFYANIINSKFTQKQESIRLQASEAAITTAVQAAEILRSQNNAITTKISTRYALNRPKDRGGYRVPKLELVLNCVARKA